MVQKYRKFLYFVGMSSREFIWVRQGVSSDSNRELSDVAVGRISMSKFK
jgi:hypothetical protein